MKPLYLQTETIFDEISSGLSTLTLACRVG